MAEPSHTKKLEDRLWRAEIAERAAATSLLELAAALSTDPRDTSISNICHAVCIILDSRSNDDIDDARRIVDRELSRIRLSS
jgi:hypothetical protein